MAMKRWGKCKKCGMQKVAFFKEPHIIKENETETIQWAFTCGNCGHAPKVKQKPEMVEIFDTDGNSKGEIDQNLIVNALLEMWETDENS